MRHFSGTYRLGVVKDHIRGLGHPEIADDPWLLGRFLENARDHPACDKHSYGWIGVLLEFALLEAYTTDHGPRPSDEALDETLDVLLDTEMMKTIRTWERNPDADL